MIINSDTEFDIQWGIFCCVVLTEGSYADVSTSSHKNLILAYTYFYKTSEEHPQFSLA